MGGPIKTAGKKSMPEPKRPGKKDDVATEAPEPAGVTHVDEAAEPELPKPDGLMLAAAGMPKPILLEGERAEALAEQLITAASNGEKRQRELHAAEVKAAEEAARRSTLVADAARDSVAIGRQQAFEVGVAAKALGRLADATEKPSTQYIELAGGVLVLGWALVAVAAASLVASVLIATGVV